MKLIIALLVATVSASSFGPCLKCFTGNPPCPFACSKGTEFGTECVKTEYACYHCAKSECFAYDMAEPGCKECPSVKPKCGTCEAGTECIVYKRSCHHCPEAKCERVLVDDEKRKNPLFTGWELH